MTCERCGCTEERACEIALEEEGPFVACWWVRPGLCAGCVVESDMVDAAVRMALQAPPVSVLEQAAADPGNPVLEAADAFNAEQLGTPLARSAPLLYDAYGRPAR